MILSIFAYPLQFFEGRNSTLILLLYLYRWLRKVFKGEKPYRPDSEINEKQEEVNKINFDD